MIIVGGLPKPIGGVTSFLKRLVLKYDNKINLFIDLYPSSEKNIPVKLIERYKCFNKIYLPWFLFKESSHTSEIFFNFSRLISLFLFFFIRKKKQKWYLMLHHGDLTKSYLPVFLVSMLLKRFDIIYAINDNQYNFFQRYVSGDNIINSTSYIPISEDGDKVDIEALRLIDTIRNNNKYKYIFSCSGYPTDIYRHELSIKSVIERDDSAIIVCLYGEGNIKELEDKYLRYENVFFIYFLSEDSFNYLLKNIDCYLRPNLVDSFGVAVADAINLGTCVIASNVCPRYRGAILFNSSSETDFKELVHSYPNFDPKKLVVSNIDIIEFEF